LNHQDVGKALMEVSRTAAQTGLYVPTELTLLGKTLLQLEEGRENFVSDLSIPMLRCAGMSPKS
jgi:predicted unusual protein kinase regulating ubiquinone biosynthesis (AarF/ABC1/UbiB family)